MSQSQRLAEGIAQLGLEVDGRVQQQLLAYLTLLVKWNRAYNLTAVRDPLEMVTRHLLDSLAVLPHLHGNRTIDVGSGAGLPGIPLALALPDHPFTLLDSNGKKTRFLVQAKGELGLANVTVVQARVEAYQPPQRFDSVISRAFANLPEILSSCRHLLSEQGEFLAMKGELAKESLDALGDGFQLLETIPLAVPGLEQEQRHLLRLCLA